MSQTDFRMLLIGAMAGIHEDLEKILKMYMPLIERNSYVDGIRDEDLKQYLMIHIALKISKFPLE